MCVCVCVCVCVRVRVMCVCACVCAIKISGKMDKIRPLTKGSVVIFPSSFKEFFQTKHFLKFFSIALNVEKLKKNV